MPINRRAKTLTIPMDDQPVHTLPEHPFCGDLSCPCHDDKELVQEYLTTPWQNGHLTNKEADQIFHGQQIR